MMVWFYTIILCISALLFSLVGTWGIRLALQMFVAPREPNDRDNHSAPVPKGGGLALMLSATGFLLVAGIHAYVIWALVALITVSFFDDVSGVSPLNRLIIHILAACLMVLPLQAPVLNGLIPAALEFPVLVIMLVWFMNLYNFMDGIDELTCYQTGFMTIMIIVLIVMIPALKDSLAYDSAIILSTVVGFWIFNRHPATIFMGDSGSIPLGALMGWMLLFISSQGYWMIALMLPAYYVTDSGITMVRRLLSGKKPWEAHSEHAYQRYIRSGHSHRAANAWIIACNLVIAVLIIVSVNTPDYGYMPLAGAYSASALLYIYFISCRESFKSKDVMPHSHAVT